MNFKVLLPAFSLELEKLAKVDFSKRVDQHHESVSKDWKGFEKGLQRKGFRAAVLTHPKSDEKLKKYVEAYGGYLASKDVVGVVPSRTSGKLYKIKELPGGRLGCGCKDWQFKHSHQGTDCAHIKELGPVLEKTSGIARGAGIMRMLGRSADQYRRGTAMKENVERLRSGQELRAIPKKRIV